MFASGVSLNLILFPLAPHSGFIWSYTENIMPLIYVKVFVIKD